MTLRDGVTLRANLTRPDDEAKYPVLLLRLPYGKDLFMQNDKGQLNPYRMAEAGYNVVVQDCRGFGRSDGEPAVDGSNDREDGYDAVEWAAEQPWSDGAVGTFGLSFFGFVQIAAASRRPPHLRTACPFMCGTQCPITTNTGGSFAPYHLQWLYNEALGQLAKMEIDEREREHIRAEIEKNRPTLMEQCRTCFPLTGMPAVNIAGFPHVHEFVEAIGLMDDPEYWRRSGIPYDFSEMRVPMLHLTGWNDTARDRTIQNYLLAGENGGSELMRRNQRLIVGPWRHGELMSATVGDIDYGPGASGEAFGVMRQMLAWFDFWLKGRLDALEKMPAVSYFTLGENAWHSADAWPPQNARATDFYLGSGGDARGSAGNGTLSATPGAGAVEDAYLHDPLRPLPAAQEGECEFNGDFSAVQTRKDMAVYTSAPLTRDTEVTGNIRVRLYAVIDGADGDFWCRLTDVDERGAAHKLVNGMVRARYRNGLTREELIEPGKPYAYDIDLGNTSNLFRAGHRIRLDIAGSCFPTGDINLSTADRAGDGSDPRKAVHHILHDGDHPSRLILPVVAR